jgi:hypothetical protein
MVVQRTFTQAELDDAVAQAGNADREKNFAEGGRRERARVSAIVRSGEAKGREDLAQKFALDTSMTAEQAIGLLKTLPQTPAQALPTDRARLAPGGLVVEGAQSGNGDPNNSVPTSNYDQGREIASRLPPGLRA